MNKVNNKMEKRFKIIAEVMPSLLQTLLRKQPITIDSIGTTMVPQKGVYVFSEGDKAIYVGRSNRMKQRLKEHSQRGSDRYSATLAFKIAKQEYFSSHRVKKRETNEQLKESPIFCKKFDAAKDRIAKARIRFIEIEDQVEQTIFEVYAALALDTELNDFGTH